MSSLTSIVTTDGVLRRGDSGPAVQVLQAALQAAGYRVALDGDFGPGTEYAARQFQSQHGLKADGVVGLMTATLLDASHAELVNTAAAPVLHSTGWPHDDTASLLAFYSKPWEDSRLLTRVDVPFPMTYESTPVRSVQVHVKVAPALTQVFDRVASAAKADPSVLKHVQHFSGSYNYRAVRGSSRLSCHAFGAALDFDAEHLQLGSTHAAAEMPQQLVDIFKATGAFWGGDYRGRKDPMHFQWAHE